MDPFIWVTKMMVTAMALLTTILCSLDSPVVVDRPWYGSETSCNLSYDNRELCCTWKYLMDRYCCETEDDPVCEDDCTEEERIEDKENALWGADSYCVQLGYCRWIYNGGGVDVPPMYDDEEE